VPQKVTELLAGLGIGVYGVVQDVSFAAIFKGVLPFIITDILRLVIPIAFRSSRSGCLAGCSATLCGAKLDANFRSTID
jgi:hypothetical protein